MSHLAPGHRAARIAVIGDRLAGFTPQESIQAALEHSGAFLGVLVEVEWIPTPTLLGAAHERLQDADGVWCAPGSPFVSLEGALEGIRFAREHGRPFLGTCAGFQHAVIEFARNVLGVTGAQHAEYGQFGTATLFIDELLCSLVGRTMTIHIVDPRTCEIYGSPTADEQYYCRFGLNEVHKSALAEAGLTVAAVDAADETTRIMTIADHPFFYATLFVPQTASTRAHPHPIVTGYLSSVVSQRSMLTPVESS